MKLSITILLVAFWMNASSQARTFDSSAQGWTTVGDAPNVIHNLTGGNTGGYVKAKDLGQGVTWYWIADSVFHGNKSQSYGNYIRFDITTTTVNQGSASDGISISGSGLRIIHTVAPPSINSWTHYDILISDTSNWKIDSSSIWVNASAIQIQNVLDSVTEIKLRGEYSNVVGDWGSLDNFILEQTTTQSPSANISASDSSFCEKQCIDFFDLSLNNPTSWKWAFSGASPYTSTLQNPTGICYNNYGSFDVSLIACNSAGCDTVIYTNFINEFQNPIDSIWQLNGQLISLPGNSYQWYEVTNGIVQGATGIAFQPTAAGNYYCIITDVNGCNGVSNIIYSTEINSIYFENGIFVHPNPFTDELTVEYKNKNAKNATCEIKNVLGQVVYSDAAIIGLKKIIDFRVLQKGIYFLEMKNENSKAVIKLLKQ